MANDDVINLGGQAFPVKGFTRGNSVSEFETGIKIGRASYDQREHAFFLVLDDFSGGFGHRRLDIREELGTFWDSSPATSTRSPDSTRPGHLTLSPEQGQVTLTGGNPTTFNATIRSPSKPWVNAAGVRQLVGLGSGIYGSTDGLTFSRLLVGGADAAECEAIVEVVSPGTLAAGTLTRHYAFFSSVALATTGTARYQKSTDNGATWANGESDKVLHDAIFWDKKIISVWGRGIIFGVVDSVTGNVAWNIDDVNDGEYIFTVPSGHIHFVRIAEAPWG